MKWIPCAEKTPANSGKVIACTHNGLIYILHYSAMYGLFNVNDDHPETIPHAIPVIAWMPLPGPYSVQNDAD